MGIDRIAIVQQRAGSRVPGEGLGNLWRRPFRSGIGRDVEMNHAAPMRGQKHKDKQNWKADDGDDKEIRRNQVLNVMAEEGASRRRRRLVPANHVLGDCRWGPIDSEFEQFAVNARCAPERICHIDFSHEVSEFLRHFGPSRLAPPTRPGPVQTESLAMPGDHRLRLDDDQR